MKKLFAIVSLISIVLAGIMHYVTHSVLEIKFIACVLIAMIAAIFFGGIISMFRISTQNKAIIAVVSGVVAFFTSILLYNSVINEIIEPVMNYAILIPLGIPFLIILIYLIFQYIQK